MNILICMEKEKSAQYCLSVVREQCDHARFHVFHFLQEAWRKALTTRMDLMILELPKGKGLEKDEGLRTLECIRRTKEYLITPMILLSDLEDTRLYGYNRLHAYACYQKPVNKIVFQQDIGDLLLGLTTENRQSDHQNMMHSFHYRNELYVVRERDLVRLQRHSHTVNVVTVDHRFRVDIRSLQQEADLFESGRFLQCNRSDFVNPMFICLVEKHRVILKGKYGMIPLTNLGRKNAVQMFRNNPGSR